MMSFIRSHARSRLLSRIDHSRPAGHVPTRWLGRAGIVGLAAAVSLASALAVDAPVQGGSASPVAAWLQQLSAGSAQAPIEARGALVRTAVAAEEGSQPNTAKEIGDGQTGNDSVSSTLADVMVTIGTLPAGKQVTIVFDADVNSPLTGTATQACNQGTFTATSPAATSLTDDPATVAVDDPTCTDLGRPDLTAVKTNTVGGSISLPGSWDWRIDVTNAANTGAATFASGQVILKDDLPNTNIGYSAPIVSNQVGIGGTGSIGCSITTFTLTCTATGGTVTIAEPGGFRVTTTATPTAPGTYANPRAAGVCAVDPDASVVESNDGNNDCSDSVVVTAPDLTATKTNTVGGGTTLGNTWDWRVDVANIGNGSATFASGQVILKDDLPDTNVSYSAAVVSNQVGISGAGTIGCSITTFTLTCTASGGTVTMAATTGSFRVTTTATPTAIGTFDNPRAAGVCAADPNLSVFESNEANNSCSDSVVVTVPDLTATKTNTVGGGTTLGNTWDWRIDVANGGSGPATFTTGQTILKDDLPNTNVSYSAPTVSLPVGIGGTGTISCSIVTFTLSCTASGGTVTIAAAGGFRVTTTATPTATGTFGNPRAAGVCATDPNLNIIEADDGNNACSDSVVVTVPDLTATKTNSVGGTATVGLTFDWRIDLDNGGSGPATFTTGQTILKDDLPNTNVTYAAPVLSNQVGLSGGGTVSCSIASFTLTCTASGGSVTIAAAGGFRVTTTATPTAVGVLDNPRALGVCAADPNLNIVESSDANNACSDSVTVTNGADLKVTKTESADPAVAGTNLTYVVTVENLGGLDATGVTLSEAITFPPGVSIVSITPSGTTTYSPPNGANGTWTVGNLANGASATLTVVLAIDPIAGAGGNLISDTATVTNSDQIDPVSGNNSATEATSIVRQIDLAVTKTESADPVTAGSGPNNLTYVVTVQNNGPSTANGITLSEVLTLPAGVTVSSITPSGGTTYAPPNASGTWTVGGLTVGQSQTLMVVLTVGPSAADGTNTVGDTVTVTGSNETRINTGNDSQTVLTSIQRRIDLKVTKTESSESVVAGSGPGNLTYVVTVQNLGPSDASGVVLSEVLTVPSGVTIDSITPSGTTTYAPPNAANGTWTVGALAPGASRTLTVVLTVGVAAAPGTDVVGDTATVTASNEVRINTGDDSDTEFTSIVVVHIIATKTDTPDPVAAGSLLTYVLGIENDSPIAVDNVTVTDVLPLYTTFHSITPPSGWTCSGTTTVTCTKPSMAAHEVALITLKVTVAAGTPANTVINNTMNVTTGIGVGASANATTIVYRSRR